MCGRFALSLSSHELESAANDIVGLDEEWPSTNAEKYRPGNYNVAPQTNVPVIRRTFGGRSFEGSSEDGSKDEQGVTGIRVMKWGLIPQWMKRPDYASALKTINARDDNVLSGTGMWNSIRGKRRCVILADGFYEWVRKGKDKIPYFVKRKDGKLMCMAGLWDHVQYEDSDQVIYSFTIITTDNCRELAFLHDRMPFILDNKDDINTWLDTSSNAWSKKLSDLVKPYDGKQLTVYAVPSEVGKVGNNSPDFIKPVTERKGNIASFFVKSKTSSPKKESVEKHDTDDEKEKTTKPKGESSSDRQKPVKRSASPISNKEVPTKKINTRQQVKSDDSDDDVKVL